MKPENNNRYINYDKKSHTAFGLISLIFWIAFILLSTYEGYFPDGIGGLTRYLLLLWMVFMILRIGSGIFLVKKDQFIWLVWLVYYLISLGWTTNLSQAQVYVFSVTLMTLLCIIIQYFSYGPDFWSRIMEIYKFASVSLAFLSIFFFIDIGAGTRRVLYIFNTYVDPNGQVATIAIGSGLSLCSVFDAESSIKKKIVNLIGFLICCYSVFQTGSRSGIVVLAVQFIIILLFWHPQNNNLFKEGAKWILLLLLGLIAIYFMTNYISVDIVDRLLGRGNLDFFDGTQREERWTVGLDYFFRHPIIGNGWGAFECHNTYLTMLVDVGVLGNLMFYYIIIKLYLKAFRNKDIQAIMILTSGLLPAFFIGAQNKRFFWGAIMLTSLLINCKEDKNYGYQNTAREVEGPL